MTWPLVYQAPISLLKKPKVILYHPIWPFLIGILITRSAFLQEGEVTHYTDFEKYTIKAPALLMLALDQVHQQTGNSYYKMMHISFNKEFLLTETQGVLACWECMFSQVVLPVMNIEQMQEISVYH